MAEAERERERELHGRDSLAFHKREEIEPLQTLE